MQPRIRDVAIGCLLHAGKCTEIHLGPSQGKTGQKVPNLLANETLYQLSYSPKADAPNESVHRVCDMTLCAAASIRQADSYDSVSP